MDSVSLGARAARYRWLLTDVLVPFLATRLGLLLVARFSRLLGGPPGDYVGHGAGGFSFVRNRLLDVWGRWDTEWYLRIIRDGYQVDAFPRGWSRIAFFPLYPQGVRALYRLLPESAQTREAAYLLGLVVANVLALAALAALHAFVRQHAGNVQLARRVVLYVLVFPTGFFLSCVYTESLFLLLAVATFHFGMQQRWALAGASGFLLATTRYSGVLATVSLAWMYLESIGWNVRRLRPSVLWLALVPAGLAVYAGYLWHLTDDPLAVFHVQAAWSKRFTLPWDTLRYPVFYNRLMTPIDRFMVLLFLVVGVALLCRRATVAGGLFVLLSLPPILFSGSISSASRYMLVLFPAFVLAARLGHSAVFDRAYLVVAMSLQALLMAFWSNWHWVA